MWITLVHVVEKWHPIIPCMHKQWAFLSPESSVQSRSLHYNREKHACIKSIQVSNHSFSKSIQRSSSQLQRIHEIDSLLVVNALYSSIPVTITSLHDWNFNIWRLFCYRTTRFISATFVCFFLVFSYKTTV